MNKPLIYCLSCYLLLQLLWNPIITLTQYFQLYAVADLIELDLNRGLYPVKHDFNIFSHHFQLVTVKIRTPRRPTVPAFLYRWPCTKPWWPQLKKWCKMSQRLNRIWGEFQGLYDGVTLILLTVMRDGRITASIVPGTAACFVLF